MEYFSNFFKSDELSMEEKLKLENENLKQSNEKIIDEFNSLKINYHNLNANLKRNNEKINNDNMLREILNNDLEEKNKTISYLQLKLNDCENKMVSQATTLEQMDREVRQMFYQMKVLTEENKMLKNKTKKLVESSTQTNNINESKSTQTSIDFTKFHFKED